MQRIDTIKQKFDEFGQISKEDWNKVYALASVKHIKKGEFFVRAGEVKDYFGIMIKGCMRYYYLRDGTEFTGEFWRENELVASYEGCILQKAATQYIEAIEDTELVVLSYHQLKELSAEVKGLDQIIIALLENFIVESQQRIEAYIVETPEQRYLRMREEMPGLEDRVHQKYIASFLGVTPVTLSRIRARLAKR